MKNYSQNPISIRSREWIVNALVELMKEKPFSKISIKEITDKAQLARRTFYGHFDAKEDILELHIHNLICNYINLLEEKETITLYTYVEIFFEFWQEHFEFLALLINNNLIIILLRQLEKNVTVLHKQCYDEKKIQISDELLEYMSSFYAGGLLNILIKWVSDEAIKTPKEMGEIFAKLI